MIIEKEKEATPEHRFLLGDFLVYENHRTNHEIRGYYYIFIIR